MMSVQDYFKQKKKDKIAAKNIAAQLKNKIDYEDGDFSSDEDQGLLEGLIFDHLQSLTVEKREIRQEFIGVLMRWSGNDSFAEELVSKIDFKELPVETLRNFLIEISHDDILYENQKIAREEWEKRVEPYHNLKAKELAKQYDKVERLNKEAEGLKEKIAELRALQAVHSQGLFTIEEDRASTSSQHSSPILQQKNVK